MRTHLLLILVLDSNRFSGDVESSGAETRVDVTSGDDKDVELRSRFTAQRVEESLKDGFTSSIA